MRADDPEHLLRDAVEAVKEILSCAEQCLHRFEKFTMSDFASEVAPEHLDWVEPGTVGGQIQQHQASSGPAHDGFDLIVFMRIGVIPGHIEGARRMLVDQRLQQFGDFSAALAPPKQDDRLAGMVIDSAQAITPIRLPGCRDHHLLAFRAPESTQGGQPTDIELVRVVEHIAWFQVIARFFDRLFFTWYSGSGLLILCWGRLSTMSAFLSNRRTVSVETRRPVFSAI